MPDDWTRRFAEAKYKLEKTRQRLAHLEQEAGEAEPYYLQVGSDGLWHGVRNVRVSEGDTVGQLAEKVAFKTGIDLDTFNNYRILYGGRQISNRPEQTLQQLGIRATPAPHTLPQPPHSATTPRSARSARQGEWPCRGALPPLRLPLGDSGNR